MKPPPPPMQHEILLCRVAEKEHAKSKRQYAHTFHRTGMNQEPVICVCQEFWELPPEHFYGLLAHELGHIIAGQNRGEAAADIAFYKRYGITVRYKDSLFGKDLQYLDENDRHDFAYLFTTDQDEEMVESWELHFR